MGPSPNTPVAMSTGIRTCACSASRKRKVCQIVSMESLRLDRKVDAAAKRIALKLRRAEERFIPQSTRAASFKRWLGGVALETKTLMMTCNRTTKGGKKRLLRFLYQGHDKLLQISDQ